MILYVEDHPPIRNTWLAYLKRKWSENAVGVGSKSEALDKLRSGEVWPDLVLHDCEIPSHPNEVPAVQPGNELYVRLVEMGLPIVVLSGHAEIMSNTEPYRSKPPLGFVDKNPLNEGKIDEAVLLFGSHQERVGG